MTTAPKHLVLSQLARQCLKQSRPDVSPEYFAHTLVLMHVSLLFCCDVRQVTDGTLARAGCGNARYSPKPRVNHQVLSRLPDNVSTVSSDCLMIDRSAWWVGSNAQAK